MLIPIGGSIFNGFGYPVNRWMFGYAFLISLITVIVLPKLYQLSKAKAGILLSLIHILKKKEIHLLDLTALVAGTQFRGQFESRIKGLVDEVKADGNIILFIDEVHNLVGTGDAEGSMNAANILKPALSRGEIQVIGATTFTEYRKYIEKDTALERRFQPVTVVEPSVEDTIHVLLGLSLIHISVDFVGLDHALLEKSPFDLSGGEKRRAAIAGVIAMDPDVLILDEPTAGLDPQGRDHLLSQIKAYHQQRQNTVILVSHSMEDIARVAAVSYTHLIDVFML